LAKRVKLILVGGFLGAGKTTLLARAAERLSLRGLRVGLVTNDQAANLVDTQLLARTGQEVREVSGACFCCAFNKLLYICDQLILQHAPDVILAEPVGSCTDLSATVLQPLKKFCADRFELAPYSVLVDPLRLAENLQGAPDAELDGAVGYIYRKQIQEADLVVVNKTDLLGTGRRDEVMGELSREFGDPPVVCVSAQDGSGVDEWLDHLWATGPGGQHILQVDYDTYAAGEAELGWLNAAIQLQAGPEYPWEAFLKDLMARMQAGLTGAGGQIAHLKVLLTGGGTSLQANLTASRAEPVLRGQAGRGGAARLVINARVRMAPEVLRQIVEECLQASAGQTVQVSVVGIASFKPGRPEPVHRFTAIIDQPPK
jgi:Ni2+-binding GTPase involved in maturation of urease and hydrogenase